MPKIPLMSETLPSRDSALWHDWVVFLRAYKAVNERINQDLTDNGFPTLVEYSVLWWLAQADNHRLRQVELSRGVLVSKSRVTRLMHSLVEHGWVRREKTHSDKRVTYAIMTEKGKEVFDAATPVFGAAFSQYFSRHIASSEQGLLARLLLPMAEQIEGVHDITED